ncbi:MAG: molybdopterin-guanine dinucleotide biosynthesis protein B [Anaeromyxobacter sp.]
MEKLLEIRDQVLTAVHPVGAERCPLEAAQGRWLAGSPLAARPAPPHTCSAMDGWAVRAADAPAEVELRAGPALYAGDAPGRALVPGEAMRIFTGAPLPPGADAVVRQEAARAADGRVRLGPVRPGENVRQAGEDVEAGQVALPAGTRLGARQRALLAAVGVADVAVHRRPRVRVLSTGDELVAGRTPDSNGVAVAGLAEAAGLLVERRRVGDAPEAVEAALREALAGADALITIGGVSVGERDAVPAALARLGAEVRVHGVPMKPGKPFLFALAGAVPVLGLPGSPSACLAAYEVFARPALRRLAGAPVAARPLVPLRLAAPAEGRPGRARLVWAALEPDGAGAAAGARRGPGAGTGAGRRAAAPAGRGRRAAGGDGGGRVAAGRRRAGVTPVVSVAGPSGVGKTTLLVALVRALTARGLQVAVVKHTRHAHRLDAPGKDTARIRRAGASATALAAPAGTVVIGPPAAGPRALLAGLPAVDLVLVEGWRAAAVPRVEVRRRAISPAFLCESDRRVLAVVADEPPPRALPWLRAGARSTPAALAALLCDRFGLGGAAAGRLPRPTPVRSLPPGMEGGRTSAPGKRDRMARTTTQQRGARTGARRTQSSGGRRRKAAAGTRSRSEAGRKGGQATLRRRGPEFFSEIGRKGGRRRGARARAAGAAKSGGRRASRSGSARAGTARRTGGAKSGGGARRGR